MQTGQALAAKFDENRTMKQRSLMRAEMVLPVNHRKAVLTCSALARSMTTLSLVI